MIYSMVSEVYSSTPHQTTSFFSIQTHIWSYPIH